MLILNCTKAATDFFSVTRQGKKISFVQPPPEKVIDNSKNRSHWHWLVHAVKVKGKNTLIAMEYHSRFSITLTALKKGDDSTFLNLLEHHLLVHVDEILTSAGIEQKVIDASVNAYRQEHSRCAFYQRGDRSVQAHINDALWCFRCGVDEWPELPVGVELIGFDAYANKILRKRKGDKDYFYPQDEFLSMWLTHYCNYNEAEVHACFERLDAKERSEFAARNMDASFVQTPLEKEILASVPVKSSSNVISLDAYRKKS